MRVTLWVTKINDYVYLLNQDLIQLKKLNLNNYTALEKTKDLFLLNSYSGLRYSDYLSLTMENIVTQENGSDVFKVFVKKILQTIFLPIHSVIKLIT
jgi:hypothetical protein